MRDGPAATPGSGARALIAALCCAAFAGAPLAAAAASPPYQVLGDELDPGAPTASLPQGPVDQAIADLAATPGAKLLVPRRDGAEGGVRYALAAWRSEPGAPQWDALLVLALPEGARSIEITSSAKDVEATLATLLEHALGSAPPKPVAPPAPAAAQARLPMPERFDLRFVVLYEPDPAYRVPTDAAAADAVVDAHIQYQLRLAHDGRALANGPFVAAASAAGRFVGMTLLRVKDLATAEAIAAADPAVKAGRLKATVRAWNTPAGQLR